MSFAGNITESVQKASEEIIPNPTAVSGTNKIITNAWHGLTGKAIDILPNSLTAEGILKMKVPLFSTSYPNGISGET